jgi:intracellular multiplication protein IcmE
MAGKKENLKGLFSNTRTRVVIIFTLVVLVTTVLIGVFKFTTILRPKQVSTADLGNGPAGMLSIPGARNQTAEYAGLQTKQNIEQAEQARKTGTSSIPTLVSSQGFGNGVESVGPQGGSGGLGFSGLALQDAAGPQQSLWLQNLQESNCSKKSVESVVGQGAVISDLIKACSCVQLKDDGYQFNDLTKVCSCKDLKAAGFSAREMKDAGFSAARLRSCGFDACELRAAGFTAQQMKDAGFSDDELKGAGYSPEEIARASGLPDGITADIVRKAGCQADALQRLRLTGVSAAAIRRISGCSAAQLKAAGFTAQDLKNAGFSAADLLRAGFTPTQLKAAGYSARDLLDAGVTPAQLEDAGFSPASIRAAEAELPPGMTADDVKSAGCSAGAIKRERLAGVSATLIHKYAGCSAKDLASGGFTAGDLSNAGFTPDQLKGLFPAVSDDAIRAAGCDVSQLKVLFNEGVSAKRIHDLNGCSADALKKAGYSAGDLLNAGFTPQQLLAAGFTPSEIKAGEVPSDDAIRAAGCDPEKLKALFAEGVNARRIHDLNGCSADALKKAGFSAKDLLNAGFTPAQLLAAGFTPAEVKAGELASEQEIRAAGCDPQKLRLLFQQGVSAKRIHDLNGCSAAALKQAGFSDKDLLAAGFTPEQLLAAGFTPADIKADQSSTVPDSAIKEAGCDPQKLKALLDEGVSAKRIHDLNACSAEQLKAAGFDAKELADAGFTPEQLLAAGFTPQDLAKAGLTPSAVIASGRIADCSPASLKAAYELGVSATTIKQTLGCSAKALKDAGYTAAELKAAGFTAAELKNAGFSVADLRNAGFTAKELRAAGFSAAELKAAGFTAEQLKDAGFTAAELKKAGFSVDQLKAAGFSAAQLKDAGFSAEALRQAGYSAKELKDAGFSADQLKQAGFSTQELQNAGFSQQESSLAGLQAQLQPNPDLSSTVNPLPSIGGTPRSRAVAAEAENTKKLQAILKNQQNQMAEQRYQQQIQQQTNTMASAANTLLQSWKSTTTQAYVGGAKATKDDKATAQGGADQGGNQSASSSLSSSSSDAATPPLVKAGDVLFAVMETSVNSDEPGPILATIVSGQFNGAKLIGSFTLPSNADKMVIRFNTLSVPGASKTTSINAYAIDPNTARTALSSRADHHYLLRYGSLFASTFLEGFGNAFQSANTTITIGGVGGQQNTTVQNGVGRSILENAVIGLATLGKQWGQVAQTLFNTPVTVDVYAGTSVGVLFTQDLKSL